MSSHYDVEINPVVKVANQKKPKQMLWEIWNQACAEATGEVKKVLDSAAYDSVYVFKHLLMLHYADHISKNMYTPSGLPTDGPNGNVCRPLSVFGAPLTSHSSKSLLP